MKLRRERRERGDTIVEVAIALAILSATVVAVSTTSNIAFRLAVSTRQHAESTILLQQQFELLQSIRDQDVVASPVAAPDAGWDVFRGSIFAVATPDCAPVTQTISVTEGASRDIVAKTIYWSIQSGAETITTVNTDYSIQIAACYPDVIGGVPDTSKIRFTATSNWSGPGGSPQKNNAVLELVNTGNIKQADGI
jgi:Tfp pilus assembly protein PilV